jgi:hypothetical protein
VSRLTTLSPAALKALFSPDADDSLIALLTITTTEGTIRLADGYTQRISETADEVTYGVVSRGDNYIFLPFQLALPTEEQQAAPRCSITIHDVTRYLTPIIREVLSAPSVTIELVLRSTPDTVEVSLPNFLMGAIQYNRDQVTAELSVEVLTNEPFPAHTQTPGYFPGLF